MKNQVAAFSTLRNFGTFEVDTDDGKHLVIVTKPCLGRVVEATGGPWGHPEVEVRHDLIAEGETVEFILQPSGKYIARVVAIHQIA